MSWNAGIEMNKLPWIETNDFNWMNEMNDLKRMNWNEGMGSNELNWMNEMTDLTWMNWHEKVFVCFVWSTTWWWCG